MTCYLGKHLTMAMFRLTQWAALCVSLSAVLLLTGCSGIDSGNAQRSPSSRLSANPPVIIVEPFDYEHTSFLVRRAGWELDGFRRELSTSFQDVLCERLQKIAAAHKSWTTDTLPDRGWLIRGEFIKVYSGSSVLRDTVGFGAGASTFTTRVYVYDLSISSTAYILSFDTGVTEGQNGSGSSVGAIAAGGAGGAIARGAGSPTASAIALGGATAGAAVVYNEASARPFPDPFHAQEIPASQYNQFTDHYQDMARTARQIRDTLKYYSGSAISESDKLALARLNTPSK